MSSKVVLETDRLVLRELELDDADFIVELLNERSFIQNIGDRGVRTVQDAHDYLRAGPMESYRSHGFGLWVMESRNGGGPMGICGLIRREWLAHPDLGFALLPRYWSKGYAVESASAVLDLAARELGMSRLLAITSRDNRPSIELLHKLGFSDDGVAIVPDDGEEVLLLAIDLDSRGRDRNLQRLEGTPAGRGMICPCCSAEMVQERHRGVALDLCTGCHGVWFDGGELDAYNAGQGPSTLSPTTGLDRAYRPTGESAHVKCPRCQRDVLRTGTVGRHCVMRCTMCAGVFLRWPDADRGEPTAARVIRAALRALKEMSGRPG